MEAKFQSRVWDIIGNLNGTIACLKTYASHFKTNHVLIPAGMDFSFLFADLSFRFLEEVFEIIRGSSSTFKVNLKFSTLDEYY